MICYYLLINHLNLEVNCSENIETQRKIIAEKVIFFKGKVDLIIVGSSLTALLPNNYYKNSKINLSLPGGSANDGLEIIKKTELIPRYLVIETNTLFIDTDQIFINSIFAEPQFTIKKLFPVFQSQYRPINFTLSLANFIFLGDQSRNNIDKADPSVLNRTVSAYKLAYATLPHEPEFTNNLKKLETTVNNLKAKGTVVIFLEMPLHPDLINSAKQTYIRKRLLALFPKDQWLTPAEERPYEVTDGLHLLFREGLIVNQFIDKAIAGLTDNI